MPIDERQAQAIQAIVTSLQTLGSFSLPGEAVATAGFNYASVVRTTMDKDLLKRLDTMVIEFFEGTHRINMAVLKKIEEAARYQTVYAQSPGSARRAGDGIE